MPPYGGRVLADKSAWEVSGHADVRDEWREALIGGQIAVMTVVEFELLYSARDGNEYDRIQEELQALPRVEWKRSIANAAHAALRELAWRRKLGHRIPFQDALIAAAAQENAIDVLHYDGHFDQLARVLSFDSHWIAPGGTVH